ncbi:MAG: UDP-N-acetylglucosamine 1-carboxyvinyltransferase [Pseudomonadales bacterium]
MDKLLIRGGNPLRGAITISGSKNSALPILAASILSEESLRIANVPHLNDVTTMIELLGTLGVDVTVEENMTVEVHTRDIVNLRAPYDLVKTMRASFLVLGPLLALYGHAEVSLPGGCAIGPRPVDQHLKGFSALGADIQIQEGYVVADAKKGLTGTKIVMDVKTVGGTQNLMMAATLARGETIICNAAREPEVTELAACLEAMGARIEGAGTDTLTIEGVKSLHGAEFGITPDRVETGTYLIAGAATQGELLLRNTCPEHVDAVTKKLRESGASITVGEDWIRIDARARDLTAVNICTQPYPGFPTDMQAQYVALNAISKGTSRITETIFENRFTHVHELVRLGADISFDGSTTVVVNGVTGLKGAPVMATDLRASFSLVIGGLVADGETVVDRIYHIDRGYECIEEKLRLVGADVQRLASR